jgi:uncharacterized protein (DUF2062 family)
MGLHTVLGLVAAFAFGLNRVAVLLGVYSNLPWIIGPWYASTTALGAALLGTSLPPGFAESLGRLLDLSLFRSDFWRQLTALVEPLLWPFVVGSTVGSVVLAGAAYWAAFALIDARRRQMERRRSVRLARAVDRAGGAAPLVGTSFSERRAGRHVS